jgi:hypothetical protein
MATTTNNAAPGETVSLQNLLTQLRNQYPDSNVAPSNPQVPIGSGKERLGFYPNPFRIPGQPEFDNSGYFTGIQTPGAGLVTPRGKPSKTEVNASQQARALLQNLPALLSLMNAQIGPNERAQAAASAEVSPIYAQLQREIQSGNALAAAQSDKNVLLGPGGDIISIADQLQRKIDPEYYTTRTNTSNAVNDLLRPGLSGGERSEVERNLNRANLQAGTHNVPTNTSTVANAMTYGQAARDRTSQAVQQATQFLPQARSGVDVLQQGIKSPSSVSGAFSNVKQNTGQDVFGFGNNSQGIAGSTNQGITSGEYGLKGIKLQQPEGWEKVLGAIPDY